MSLFFKRLYHVKETGLNTHVTVQKDAVEDYPEEALDLADHYGTTLGANNINGTGSTNTYRYDELGNLIQDRNEHIDAIDWTVAGKVRSVDQSSGSGKKDLVFAYGAGGNRASSPIHPEYRLPNSGARFLRLHSTHGARPAVDR